MRRFSQMIVVGLSCVSLLGASACGSKGNPDFTLTMITPAVTLTQGSTNTVNVTVAPLHNSQGSINVFLSGLPASVGVAPAEATVGIGSTQMFTLTAANSAALGNATLTVTGISRQLMTTSSVSHTATLALTVTAAAAPASAH